MYFRKKIIILHSIVIMRAKLFFPKVPKISMTLKTVRTVLILFEVKIFSLVGMPYQGSFKYLIKV